MSRKKSQRTLSTDATVSFYKPQGICLKKLETIILHDDEFEAIKLHDVDDLSHIEAAKKMNISQPTFGRILNAAYKKLSTALYQGKAIAIETSKPTPTHHFCDACRREENENITIKHRCEALPKKNMVTHPISKHHL